MYKIEQFPIASKLLLKSQAHAFLLAHQPAKQAAVYKAQTLLCPHQGCQNCDVCRRISENIYPDFMYFKEPLKKEDVLSIQSQFSLSPLESDYKVYVIENIEQASKHALNSLLKFLEEPLEDVVAIFTCQSLHQVLETIVSRCQVISFNEQKEIIPKNTMYEMYQQYFPNEGDTFDIALDCLKHLIEHSNLYESLFYIQLQNLDEKSFSLFLSMLFQFLKDVQLQIRSPDYLYQKAMDAFELDTLATMQIVLMYKDKVGKLNFNTSLLIDAFFNELIHLNRK